MSISASRKLFIIAPGQEVVDVKLHTRRQGTRQWQSSAAAHAGRSVYTASLGPLKSEDGAIEYYASSPGDRQSLSDPPQAPANVYTLNVLS